MPIGAKALTALTAADIEALVGKRETTTLDFKAELPGRRDKDRLEFAADVASMWKTGGDIVFGVEDEEGVAIAVCGLGDADLDAEERRLEQIAESIIAPRLPRLELRSLGTPDGPVTILRVSPSWRGPHAVRVGVGFRFPLRGASARTTWLDIEQIRSTFVGSEELAERIRAFRDQRLSALLLDEGPFPLYPRPKVVVHVVPVTAWGTRVQVDPRVLHHHRAFRPIPGDEPGREFPNADGFITVHYSEQDQRANSYLQVFRDGALERVDAFTFRNPDKRVRGEVFDLRIVSGVEQAVQIFEALDLPLPVLVAVSLLGLDGWRIVTGDLLGDTRDRLSMDYDVLRLPDLIVEDGDDIGRSLRPILDAFWQAGGLWGSPSFDEDGAWRSQ